MHNHFLRNKRGVSTVIGTVFFVLVLIGGFSLFSWWAMRYDDYMQVVNNRNELDWEKQNEIIEIVGMSVVDSINISVANKGAVTAHLVDLWMTEFNETANWHRLFHVDYYVNLGETVTIIGADLEMPQLDPHLTYQVKIVTERGNLAVGTYSESTPEPLPPSMDGQYPKVVIGSLMLDLETFRYFPYASPNQLGSYPGGIRGYNVPSGTEMAFGCLVANVDPANRTIVLDSHSLLWFTLPASDVPHNRWWYIVNVADDGTISTVYSDIALVHGETKLIVFASADDIDGVGFSRQSTPKKSLSVSVFLLFHGSIAGTPWGQNIPFVSVYIE